MSKYKAGNYYRYKYDNDVCNIKVIDDNCLTIRMSNGNVFNVFDLCLNMSIIEWCDKHLEDVFDFKSFTNDTDAVHCKTEKEARIFCKLMEQNGMTWSDGSSYNYFAYDRYKENTLYMFNIGQFSDKGAYDEFGIGRESWNDDDTVNIIEFEDIKNNTYKRKEKVDIMTKDTFTKSDLRDWDIAIRRAKDEFEATILSITLGGMYSPNGNSYDTLDNYTDDLSNTISRDLDIMEVWRPTDIKSLLHLCDETILRDTCKLMYKRIEPTTKVYSNGKTAEENHRILWNLLADHPDWEKGDALEEMEMDGTDNIQDDCFACDAVKNDGQCGNCPICSYSGEGCLGGLFEKWHHSTGYERATYAKEIAELEWEDNYLWVAQ